MPTDYNRKRSLGDDNGFKIDIPQLADVLSRTSIQFDYLLMDACLMSEVEVAYELRRAADYLILSPAEVLTAGFPYMRIVDDLMATDDRQKRVIDVAKGFVSYYKNEYSIHWGTIGVIQTDEMESLAAATRSVISAHESDLKNFSVSRLQNYGRLSLQGSTFDFRDFINQLTDGNIPNSFDGQLNKTVLYKGSAGNKFSSLYLDEKRFSGIGCYIPQTAYTKWNNYFKTLQWYSVAGWADIN